jgi:crotonobetaine/carnitine-CoA ligase
MMPRYVDFMSTLPRTPNSKIEKYKLISDGIGASTWDRVAGAYVVSEQS